VRRSSAARAALAAAVVLLSAACGVGTGTLRIADAERRIVDIAEDVVRELRLDGLLPVAAAPLEQCTLRAGGTGLRTRVSVRAPLPEGAGPLADAFDRAATVLVGHGLALVESGVPGTLLGQLDGITVTLAGDSARLELDALTGCRPR